MLILTNFNQIIPMGMYDTLTINIAKLPITEKDQKRLNNQIFQTQDLENVLGEYRIADEGFLEKNLSVWEKTPKWEVVQDIHKDIYFYTSLGKIRTKSYEWFEFKARFSYGKLDSIIRV